MKRTLWILIQFVVALACCQSYGQVGPKLLVNGQIIDYAPQYAFEMDSDIFLRGIRTDIENSLKLGITRIGTLDLRELQASLSTVKFMVVHDGAQAIGVGENVARSGGVYFVETKTVFVNLDIMQRDPTHFGNVLRHEVLGALGYDDSSSQISTLLASPADSRDLIRSLARDTTFPRRLQTSPSREYRFNGVNAPNALESQNSGGVTVVGGGGDEIVHEMKLRLFAMRESFRPILLDMVRNDAGVRAEGVKIAGPKFLNSITDETMRAYELYLLTAPMEALSPGEVPTRPAASLEDLDNFLWVNRIRVLATSGQPEFGGPYMRVSRAHWDQPIAGHTLEESRFYYAFFLYANLFPVWLDEVYLP